MNLQNLNTSLSNAVRGGQGNSSSRWMNIVYIVAAVVIIAVVALVVVPMVLPQLSGGNRAGAPPAAPAGKPAVVKAAQSTPTATQQPTATIQPTSLPTLTPAPSETPIILVTAIAYAHSDTTTTTNCTVTASTILNLRSDPSVKQRGIGRVMAGSVLPVTGKSTDQKWWKVINATGDVNVEGWVSAQFVTADKACGDANIPVLGASATPSQN